MLQGVIKGNDCLLELDGANGFEPFVCGKDLSINTSTSMLEVTTKGDGVWKKQRPESLAWVINISSVVRFATGMNAFQIIERQIGFVAIKAKVTFRDEAGTTKFFMGTVWVTDSSLSGNAGSLAQATFTLEGDGAYKLVDCDATGLEIEVTQTDVDEFSFNLILSDGTAAIYYYTIDSGIEQQTSTLPIVLTGVAVGTHSIIITPACAVDMRGVEVSTTFTRAAEPDLTFDPVEDLLINDVTATSMRANWTLPDDAISVKIVVKNLFTDAEFTINDVPGTDYNITGLVNNTPYQVSVYANYTGGTSDPVIAGAVTASLPVVTVNANITNTTPYYQITQINYNGQDLLTSIVDTNETRNIAVPIMTGGTVIFSWHRKTSFYFAGTFKITTLDGLVTQTVTGSRDGSITFTGVNVDLSGIIINID